MKRTDYFPNISSLRRNGFAVFKNVFNDRDLSDIKHTTSVLINKWKFGYIRTKDFWSYIDDESDEILYRIHNFENYSTEIEKIIGKSNFVNLVEDVFCSEAYPRVFALIVKMQNKGASVPWHRDIEKISYGEAYNFSIYLDDSFAENGCLEVVPGTHKDQKDYSKITLAPKNSVRIPAQVGDVVVHDVRLLHGSSYSNSQYIRRSIVIEFNK